MRTIRTKVYQFSELSKDAQQKAIEVMAEINVDHDWWQSVYEDAANIGLKITGFDIDRGSYCKGEFIEDAQYTGEKILSEHGKICETYKTASEFIADREKLDIDEQENELEELEMEFLNSLLEDYRIMLTKEYEYQTSEAAIIETIEANEYEFKADGTRF